jgi:hypothetical protein
MLDGILRWTTQQRDANESITNHTQIKTEESKIVEIASRRFGLEYEDGNLNYGSEVMIPRIEGLISAYRRLRSEQLCKHELGARLFDLLCKYEVPLPEGARDGSEFDIIRKAWPGDQSAENAQVSAMKSLVLSRVDALTRLRQIDSRIQGDPPAGSIRIDGGDPAAWVESKPVGKMEEALQLISGHVAECLQNISWCDETLGRGRVCAELFGISSDKSTPTSGSEFKWKNILKLTDMWSKIPSPTNSIADARGRVREILMEIAQNQ